MLPSQLTNIIADFQLAEGREKLELLLQYAEELPPLPAWLHSERDQMESVPECMTPVHVIDRLQDGKMIFYFDVPRESPTVRGFAAVMSKGLNDTTPEQVLQIPNDFYVQMGLDQVLTPQRINGISAILAHLKQLAVREIGKSQAS